MTEETTDVAATDLTTLRFENHRTEDADTLNILLSATAALDLGGITQGQSRPLRSLADPQITFQSLTSGRLYVGLGDLAENPAPRNDTYYGWIEFSRTPGSSIVWLNLSNVDLTGLPLAISGVKSNGAPFSLGLAKSTDEIINDLFAVQTGKDPSAARITTSSGQTKCLSPTLAPDSYRNLEPYLDSLCKSQAPLKITSDTLNGKTLVFTGSFTPAQSPDDIGISLTDQDGKQLTITRANLNNAILYRCAGGSLTYDGQSRAQNDPNTSDPDSVLINSVFRNLMIGINEGYFTADGPNDSNRFRGLDPFPDGQGNQYAQVIHKATNSYGFPYADSNLKVLITADATKPITVTILKDNEAFGYQKPDKTHTANEPSSGTYQFGIGAGSSALGSVMIGNYCYPGGPNGAPGGYLPDLPDWTPMEFTGPGPGHYIWIKNGQIEAGNCLSAPCSFNNNVFAWPANLTWNAGAKPPEKPRG
ncbi:MAG: hypothetical protein HWE23_09535 [Rhodobacteraceae bacterium]|nr:hypothetical protein [Paracoccaceae bacterium]